MIARFLVVWIAGALLGYVVVAFPVIVIFNLSSGLSFGVGMIAGAFGSLAVYARLARWVDQ